GLLDRWVRAEAVERIPGEVEQDEDDDRYDEKCDHALDRSPDEISRQRGHVSNPRSLGLLSTEPYFYLVQPEPPTAIGAAINGKGTGLEPGPFSPKVCLRGSALPQPFRPCRHRTLPALTSGAPCACGPSSFRRRLRRRGQRRAARRPAHTARTS